ncbi:hypothetical protein, partial [Rathayibacter sp. AY1F8]|uniref:hypothetical protein n=1 Tax=Rathayibacter sp. AY1F8 TaxID=2080562 RepID=UPI001CA582D3
DGAGVGRRGPELTNADQARRRPPAGQLAPTCSRDCSRDCSRVVALDAQCDNSWTLVALSPRRAAATIQKSP